MADLAARGELRFEQDGAAIKEEKAIKQVLGQAVDQRLEALARMALFME